MTFRQTTVALTLAGLVLVYGYFFFVVMGGQVPTGDAGAALETLITGTVLIVVFIVAARVGLAIFTTIFRRGTKIDQRTDERDALVSLKGARSGYVVLVAGSLGTLALFASGAAPSEAAFALLGTLVAAEIANYASQLVYYQFR